MAKNIRAWWRAPRGRARADAADMILSYGDVANEVASRLARAERRHRVLDVMLPPGHWERVRREVARQTGRPFGPPGQPRDTP